MFAFRSTLAALLMLTSSASLVNAEDFVWFAPTVAQNDWTSFVYKIKLKCTTIDFVHINANNTGTIEACAVKAFNEVHDPAMITLYNATLEDFTVTPGGTWRLRSGVTSTGTYSIGGSIGGIGGSCRRCNGMLGWPFFKEWAVAFRDCLRSSGATDLANVDNFSVDPTAVAVTAE
jgi:hypothetical protein